MGNYNSDAAMYPAPFTRTPHAHGLYTAGNVAASAEDMYLQIEAAQERTEYLIEQYGSLETMYALSRLPEIYQQAYLVNQGNPGQNIFNTAAELGYGEDIRAATVAVRWADFLFEIASEHERRKLPPNVIDPDFVAAEVLSANYQPVGAVGYLRPYDLDLIIQHDILGKPTSKIAAATGQPVELIARQVKQAHLLHNIAKQRFADNPDASQAVLDPHDQHELLELSGMEPLYVEARAAVTEVIPQALVSPKEGHVFVHRSADSPAMLALSLEFDRRSNKGNAHALQCTIFNVPESAFMASTGLLGDLLVGAQLSDEQVPGTELRGHVSFSIRTKEELAEVMAYFGRLHAYQSNPDKPSD